MSRASVADAAARAGARRGFVNLRSFPSSPFRDRAPPSTAPTSAAPTSKTGAPTGNPAAATRSDTRQLSGQLARWSVPAALSLVLVLLGALLLRYAYEEQKRVVTTATNDLSFAVTVIADDIAMRSRENPAAPPSESLTPFASSEALSRGQRIFVSDEAGRIVAALPTTLKPDGLISDQLGPAQPLSVFAEKAGVMRLVLPDGQEALATVHSLPAPLGQVVVIHPLDDILNSWRSAQTRTLLLFLAAGVGFAALVLAYLRQAARTCKADNVCKTMRDRVDMVLARGRCGLWDWDLASGRIEWSRSMFEILGLAPRDTAMAAADVDLLIHPGDGGLDTIARKITSGDAALVEHVFRMRSAAGGWVWLRVKAEMVASEVGGSRLVGVAVDITDTMVLEERTAKADMRLRDAIETISEAFVVWDADNHLVMCNSKFQRFHNLPAEAVAVGTPYTQVMERGSPPLIHSQIALGEQQPLGARTFEAQLGDGRWLQINERRTKDGGYVSVGTDITTLKRHEEQLLESERRLMNTVIDLRKSRQKLEAQAQELADLADKYLEQKAQAETANRAKSDFLANMGHELRTPLNAILGFSEVMMLESFGKLGSPQYLDYSNHIHSSGHHLLAVIADLLEMARLEAGRVRLEKTDFAIEEAMKIAVAAVKPAAEGNGIAIELETGHDTEIFADRTALEKILTIFLNNAVKYTPADGRIVVRSRIEEPFLTISVADSGVGMPPDAVARLGHPFEQLAQTTKNGIRGSGLGLAIARSLVELHGGSMRLASEEGVGTTVLIQIPHRARLPRPQQRPAPAMTRLPAQPVRIAQRVVGKRTA